MSLPLLFLTAALGASPAARQETTKPVSTAGVDLDACHVPAAFKSLWPDPKQVSFQPTTLEERAVFEKLVPGLLEASRRGTKVPERLRTLAGTVGFQLETWRHGDETWWVLSERPDARRGAGAYVFRTGEAAEIILQAPHVFFDLGTDTLGAALFACAEGAGRPRAFITNTAHRFRGLDGERRGDLEHPADLAHNPDHLFQVATNAMVQQMEDPRVIQLHGFGSRGEKRRKLAAVVSSGTRRPTAWARGMSARLAEILGEGVKLYPDQTEALGGTRNAQSRLLQAYPRARFVHLELSSEVRRSLGCADAPVARAEGACSKGPSREVRRLARALFEPGEG